MTLREARIARGLSVREAANLIGVAPSSVVAWELHGAMPKGETLLKAAEIYKAKPAAIRRGEKKAAS